jgi:hypothetical protein
MFEKGHEKIGGRKKGTQNKTSTEIRKNAYTLIRNRTSDETKSINSIFYIE